MSNRSANAFADASLREATATTSAPGRRRTSPVNVAAIPPVASTPHRTGPVPDAAPLSCSVVIYVPCTEKVTTNRPELRA